MCYNICGVVKEMKISVIIPIFNVEPYLRQCLDSILNQSIDEMEIICVDDGSTDGSLEVLQQYEKTNPQILLIPCKHRGLSATRNEGLKIARGEFVYFVDGDDIVVPGALEKLYGLAVSNDLDIISFTAELLYEDDAMREINQDILYRRERLPEGVFDKGVLTGPEILRLCIETDIYLASVWSYFYRLSLLRQNRLSFIPCLHEDEDFSVRALLLAERGLLLQDSLYVYRQRRGSIVYSQTNRMESLYGEFKCGLSILRFVNEGPYSADVATAVAKHASVLFEMARRKFETADEEEQESLASLMNPVEAVLFDYIVQSPVETKRSQMIASPLKKDNKKTIVHHFSKLFTGK